MSLLAETQTKQAAAPSKWAGKVRALGVTAPWWNTASTVAVVEVQIADVLTVLCHVSRGKNGRMFANAPSAKRGDEWIAAYDLLDRDLAKAVQAVAVQAAEAWQATGGHAQGAPDDDDMPF